MEVRIRLKSRLSLSLANVPQKRDKIHTADICTQKEKTIATGILRFDNGPY